MTFFLVSIVILFVSSLCLFPRIKRGSRVTAGAGNQYARTTIAARTCLKATKQTLKATSDKMTARHAELTKNSLLQF
jgi:hypothetical protein